MIDHDLARDLWNVPGGTDTVYGDTISKKNNSIAFPIKAVLYYGTGLICIECCLRPNLRVVNLVWISYLNTIEIKL